MPKPMDDASSESVTGTLGGVDTNNPIAAEQPLHIINDSLKDYIILENGFIGIQSRLISLAKSNREFDPEDWSSLVGFYKKLLDEQQDFMWATAHPFATEAVRRLAKTRSIPDKTWLRTEWFLKLPAVSKAQKLDIIDLAWMHITRLEKQPLLGYRETWPDYLGRLAHHRALLEDDPKNHEPWISMAKKCYSEASHMQPTLGRLYHSLAEVEEDPLQQMFYYVKSLCVPIPFLNTRESLKKLLDSQRSPETKPAFVRAHAQLCANNMENFHSSVDEFIKNLDSDIDQPDCSWMKSSHLIAILLACALLEYGSESNVLMMPIKPVKVGISDIHMKDNLVTPSKTFLAALEFTARTHNVVFSRLENPSVMPYLHVTLLFLCKMSRFPDAMNHIEKRLPWKLISLQLNKLLDSGSSAEMTKSGDIPRPEKDTDHPLFEDSAQRDLLWLEKHYPDDWFMDIEYDKKHVETASMMEERKVMCLRLADYLASLSLGLTYDETTKRFWVKSQYDIEIPDLQTKGMVGKWVLVQRLGNESLGFHMERTV